MADVRALLKAKRQEARINHPLASYSSNGQLRCIVCGSTVKHASAWEGHVISKGHRQNVTRLKEEERAKELEIQQQQVNTAKRKAEEEEEEISENEPLKKRRVGDDDTHAIATTSSFPGDFFSDPSRAPPPSSSDSEDEDAKSTIPPTQPTTVDLEWEQFQREVINAPDDREIYAGATLFVEPVLASETPQGFPSMQQEEVAEEPTKLDEEQARRKKEQDERELIMDRLVDEERAQEEADAKVSSMKLRLEELRRKREAARLAKAKLGT